ncbi:MAG: cytochrome c3 family protein [Steroidobacteraceae bacterium]
MPVPSMEATMNKPAAWTALLLVLVFGGLAETRAEAPKDVIVLTGSPLGGVRFEHKLHVTRADNDCATCHHPSRTQKPASAPQQACSTCHTKVAAAPMKTKHQAAFHDPMAQSGTCIDCHKAVKATAKKAPLGCMDCHKKESK